MLLHSYASSPYSRKVRMVIQLLGFADRIETRQPDLYDETDPLMRANPLGKVPALVRDDGIAVCDSPVIVEYLDLLAGGGHIIPRDPEERVRALTLQAWCDGGLDACLLIRVESIYRPPEHHSARYIERQKRKIERLLDTVDAALPRVSSMPDVGQITLACLLGYRDFRFDCTWREKHPRLHAWHDAFAAAVPAFAATSPHD
jgi:glutathione S-transferase